MFRGRNLVGRATCDGGHRWRMERRGSDVWRRTYSRICCVSAFLAFLKVRGRGEGGCRCGCGCCSGVRLDMLAEDVWGAEV
jgi:hypothetical protein